MQQVIEKALSRANQKGLGISDTAELIVEYLDIAGALQDKSDIRLNQASVPLNKKDNVLIVNSSGNKIVDNSIIEPPPFPVESVISTDQWSIDDLFNAIAHQDWEFVCRPEGRNKDLKFVGTPSVKGNIGVSIDFRSDDLDFADRHLNLIPVFVDLGSGSVDKDKLINEAMTTVMQLFRLRNAPIMSNVQLLTEMPPMGGVNRMHGFGADVS